MQYVKLNNGLSMPIVGSGTNTFGKMDNDFSNELRGDSREVDLAVENGFRHFDTAQMYRNEEMLGRGLKKSGIAREEFFITTKLNTFDGFAGEQWAHEEIAKSLEKLQTDHVDLLLIHEPWDNEDEMVRAWQILEGYYDKGVCKAIGVSNFQPEQLEVLFINCRIRPMVNQIESHPGNWNHELIAFNDANDVRTTAWGPLRGIRKKEVLKEIAGRYGKTPAQVVLRYQIQRGVIVIPKSHDKERQAQCLDIFDFELAEDDCKTIAAQ